jgi:hypothetical protein
VSALLYSVICWSSTDNARPREFKLSAMLDDIARRCEQERLHPVELIAAESWPRPHYLEPADAGDVLTRITVRLAPGRGAKGFRCWWVWQHVRFVWSNQPFPGVFPPAPIPPRSDTLLSRLHTEGHGHA